MEHCLLPQIDGRESFDVLVRKLSLYFIGHIDAPSTFESLRKDVYTSGLGPLVRYLVDEAQHPAIVSALLALKCHFAVVDAGDDRGISETRGVACELVAWRFVTHLTDREAIDYLCYELPAEGQSSADYSAHVDYVDGTGDRLDSNEQAPLLSQSPPAPIFADDDPERTRSSDPTSFASTFVGLNALEIAAVSEAKKFLSQNAIQRIIDGIWKGDIIFWDSLNQQSTKQAKIYNRHKSDPFCRLRVPLYLKMFEVLFFAVFLALYYTVLVEKRAHSVSVAEILLYIWLASFTYNELVEFWDAGSTFYSADFWSLWDLGIIATGVAFLVVRAIGLWKHDDKLIDTAFDIVSVEALFLVPRICSLLSLHPYFGTLLPCLREMTKDFVKFLSLVAIFYIGFDTTFAFLARGTLSFGHVNWILIQVFFGSSYLGFEIAEKISPILGPPLMFVFVCLTNILLVTSLISLLSNSLTKVMEHAREEYLSEYAVYVLEASTSNRLTYFLPPLNLVALLFWPLRLVFSAESLRAARIVLLKATHFPFVGLILAWETWRLRWRSGGRGKSSYGLSGQHPNAFAALRRPLEPPPLPVAGSRQAPLAEQTRSPVPKQARGTSATQEPKENLEAAVAQLRKQLETISSLLENERRVNLRSGQ